MVGLGENRGGLLLKVDAGLVLIAEEADTRAAFTDIGLEDDGPGPALIADGGFESCDAVCERGRLDESRGDDGILWEKFSNVRFDSPTRPPRGILGFA